jgi:hypothetical protein
MLMISHNVINIQIYHICGDNAFYIQHLEKEIVSEQDALDKEEEQVEDEIMPTDVDEEEETMVLKLMLPMMWKHKKQQEVTNNTMWKHQLNMNKYLQKKLSLL